MYLNQRVIKKIISLFCVRHRCICGDMVLENGLHGLSCIKSAGRIPRHREMNNTVGRTLNTIYYS